MSLASSERFVIHHVLTIPLFVVAVGFVLVTRLFRHIKRFVVWLPLPQALMRLEAAMLALPPYGAVICLLVPLGLYVGVTVVELAMLATGELLLALLASVLAKVIGIGVGLRLWGKLEHRVREIVWLGHGIDWTLRQLHSAHEWLSHYVAWRVFAHWLDVGKHTLHNVGDHVLHPGAHHHPAPEGEHKSSVNKAAWRFDAMVRRLRASKWF